jgi:dihydroneopterin aldolase
MDTIFIHDLRIRTRIGIYAWEAHMPQTVRLDLEIGVPSQRPFETGDFADALDYASVVRRLKSYASTHAHPLLERFTEGIASIVLDDFGAPWVRVRVAKLGAIPGVREVGVQIERGVQNS